MNLSGSTAGWTDWKTAKSRKDEDMKNLKPITRHEQFLQDIADGEVDLKPITRQEYFLAKIAESGGGGGSSLPSYTSSDVGKVLTLGEDAEHSVEDVVVPEQTVTTVQDTQTQYCFATVEGSTIDWASAESGDIIKLTINGTDYQAEFDDGSFVALSGDTMVGAIVFVPFAGQVLFKTTTVGGYTIKATSEVPDVKPVWEGAPRVVYDELYNFDMKTLTVSEAAKMFKKGYIIFTHGNYGEIMLLTKISDGSSPSTYDIYYNFSSNAKFSNVSGDNKVPVVVQN